MADSDGINDVQKKLTASLYRFDCPGSFELGDYRLGFVSDERKKEIDAHLRSCPHCREELQYLEEFCEIDFQLDFQKEKGNIQKHGEAGNIIPFERNAVTYMDEDGVSAVRGTTEYPSRYRKVSIACTDTVKVELLYRIRKENSFYIINGQFIVPESLMPVVADGLIEVWQNKKIKTVVRIDNLCAFRCVLRELAPGLIRVSHQGGTLLSFKLDFNR
ncbi:MAG: zf-HC2 domain-containing protein [Spirochaetales bacterium]|nr:zf-HC2 domain-containing protein [Spirochaetales bacterium]